MKLRQGDEIRVTWTDAASIAPGWKQVKTLRRWKIPRIVCLGFFAFETRDGLYYYKGRDFNDEDSGSDEESMLVPSFVPRGCILKVEVLRRAR